MRTVLTVLTVALATHAIGQDGAAIIGSGTSDQQIDVLGGAVSIDINSGGAFDLDAGGVDAGGHLGVSVDVLGIRAGIGPANPAPAEAGGVGSGAPDGVEASMQPGDAAGQVDCVDAELRPLAAWQIAKLEMRDLILVASCGSASPTDAQRQAIAGNRALTGRLTEAGYAVEQVGALALASNAMTLVITRAYAVESE